MKVKMLVHYQGYRNEGIFEPGKEYDVDKELGAYLVEHRKAVEVKEPKPEPAKKKAKRKAAKK